MAKLKDVVNGLTEDLTPDTSADYLMSYDDSESDVRKVLMDNLLAEGGAGDVGYAALQAMQLVNEVKGWPPYVPNDADLVTLNLWWDSVGTPSTAASVVDVAGEAGVTETYELALKCVTDGNGEGLYQRFTYADEPRLKAGRVCSALLAIWSVDGASITAKLLNQSAEETAHAAVTAAAWTIVEIENHTLAGTYVDLQVTAAAAGTFYVVPLGMNVGAKAFALPPRPSRVVNKYTEVVTNGDSGAAYGDVDCTAATSNLCWAINLHTTSYNGTRAAVGVFVRRNGSSTDEEWGWIPTQSAFACHNGMVTLDDGQVYEYKQASQAGDSEQNYHRIREYWEWA